MSWFSRLIGKVNRNAFHHALRSTAKAQLNAFYAIRQGFPNLSNEELYHQVLSTRPECPAPLPDILMDTSKEVANENGEPLRFQHIVFTLMLFETRKHLSSGDKTRNPGSPIDTWDTFAKDFGLDIQLPEDIVVEISNVVREIIPSHI